MESLQSKCDEILQERACYISSLASQIKKNYLAIGQALYELEQNNSFDASSWFDVFDYAEDVLHLSRSSVKNLLNVYLRFGVGDCLEQFSDYGYSQLVEFLPLQNDEILKNFDSSVSVRDIREFKKGKKVSGHNKKNDSDKPFFHYYLKKEWVAQVLKDLMCSEEYIDSLLNEYNDFETYSLYISKAVM